MATGSVKEFAIPLLVALVVAGAGAWIAHAGHEAPDLDPGGDGMGPQRSQVVFPFLEGPRGHGTQGAVLVLADPELQQRPATLTWQGDAVPDDVTGRDVLPPAVNTTATWNGGVGIVERSPELLILCVRAPCPQPVAPWMVRAPLDKERFDTENHTVSLTFYVFTERGELLASNAPNADVDRFDLSGDYFGWNDRPWYFGRDANVTGQRLPLGEDQAATALQGQPVGGIATLYLEDHEYAWLTGPLWFTARVDAIHTA